MISFVPSQLFIKSNLKFIEDNAGEQQRLVESLET